MKHPNPQKPQKIRILPLILAFLMLLSITSVAAAADTDASPDSTLAMVATTDVATVEETVTTTEAIHEATWSGIPIVTTASGEVILHGNALTGIPVTTAELPQDNQSTVVQSYSRAFFSASEAVTSTPKTRASITRAGTPTTSQEAYESLIALRAQFYEGMPWTNDLPYGPSGNLGDSYRPNQPVKIGNTYITDSRGCAAYAFRLSDILFGNLPQIVRMTGQFKYEDVRVGDHLRLYGNSHSVIVLQVTPAGCIVTEANYNKSVHWGRVISKAEVEAATYLVSRWSTGLPNDEGTGDTIVKEGKAGEYLTWALTKNGILTFKGEGPMPDYTMANSAPWSGLNYHTVIISDGITCIGINAFADEDQADNSNLVEVRIPGSVTTIKANAFRNCSKLISASIPNGIREIGKEAFYGCTSLTSVDLPGSITYLGDGAFSSCEHIETIIFANSNPGVILNVGNDLFTNCWRIHTVILPSNLPKISSGMFASCQMLRVLNIPKSIKSIESGAFSGSGVGKIYFEGSKADWLARSLAASFRYLGLDMGGSGRDFDKAVEEKEIEFNIPYVNPFATDDSDLITGTSCDANGHDWSDANGICKACGETCEHDFADTVICTICKYEHQHDWTTNTYGQDEKTHWFICADGENCPLGTGKNAARQDITYHLYNQPGNKCVCGAEQPAQQHVHTWSTTWSTDENYHWHVCTDPNCPNKDTDESKTDLALHDFSTSASAEPEMLYLSQVNFTHEAPATSDNEANIEGNNPPATPAESEDDETDANDIANDDNQDIDPDDVANNGDNGTTDNDNGNDNANPSDEDNNNPDAGDDDVNANHPVTCKVCGYAKPKDYTVPEHIWEKGYHSNTTHHWKECVNPAKPDCDVINEYAEHKYDDQTGLCVCGATKPAEQHTHVWSSTWSTDASEGGNHHWKDCTGCDARNHYAEHEYNENGLCVCGATKPADPEPPIVDPDPQPCQHIDADNNGQCDKCGEAMPGYQPPHSHVDANNDGICDECDEEIPGYQPPQPPSNEHPATFAAHSKTDFDGNGACTKSNDCNYTLAQFQDDCPVDHSTIANTTTCTTCGANGTKKDEEDPPAPPQPPAHQHDWAETLSYDNIYHWRNCLSDNCPITEANQKSDYAEHLYGNWIIDVTATAYRDGSQHRDCTVCAYRETATIPATGYYPSISNPGTSGSNNRPSNNNSGNNSTNTTQTPNKPVTTVSTDKTTGTKTETTTYPDGATTVVITETSGTIVTTNTSTTGQRDIKVELPNAVINTAKQHREPVSLPIAKVTIAHNVAQATPITISTQQNTPTLVAIPVVAPTTSTVAAIVHPDGSTEIARISAVTNGNVVTAITGNATLKIIDNSKHFADVSSNSWYAEAAAFTSARELFAGTSAETFSPELPMTRAMLMTVLARLDGSDTTSGDPWYAKGMDWAITHGISDGSNPNADITREQLVTMIWRYLGEPEASNSLSSYTDATTVSSYAETAMRWAVENGIVSGISSNSLAPQGQATRAQVAQILQRFIINIHLDPAH